MKKDKIGFTLIEVIAVIVLISLVLLIAFPTVISSYNRQKMAQWDNVVILIEEGTKNYVSAYRTQLPEIEIEDSSTTITLETLVEYGMLKWPLIDPRDNTELSLDSIVLITLTADRELIYEYLYD